MKYQELIQERVLKLENITLESKRLKIGGGRVSADLEI